MFAAPPGDLECQTGDPESSLTSDQCVSWDIGDCENNDLEWSFGIITDIHVGEESPDFVFWGWDDPRVTLPYGLGDKGAEHLRRAVNWINEKAESQKIKFVAELGDLTDGGEISEQKFAIEELDRLSVPWLPVIGNHDVWPHVKPIDNTTSSILFSFDNVPINPAVVLYQHENFEAVDDGNIEDPIGEYEVFIASNGRLRDTRVGNDRASSMKIFGDCTVTLWDDFRFPNSGGKRTFSNPGGGVREIPRLSDYGFNDTTSAVEITNCATDGVVLYEDENYENKHENFIADSKFIHDDGRTTEHIIARNAVSSVVVKNNCRVTFFGDNDEVLTLTSSAPRLSDFNWDNRAIKEIKIDRCNNPSKGAYLYQKGEFSGRAELFLTNIPSFRNSFVGNNVVTSIKPLNGALVALYKNINYDGGYTLFDRDVINFVDLQQVASNQDTENADNQVASVKFSEWQEPVNSSVVLYKNANFEGPYEVFIASNYDLRGGGIIPIPTRIGDDAASSMRIFGACKVTLYEDPKMGGGSFTRENVLGVMELGNFIGQTFDNGHSLQNAVSSVEIENCDTDGVVLYTDSNYQGRQENFITDTSLKGHFLPMNKVSSVFVKNCPVTLFDDTGLSLRLTSSAPQLSLNGWDDAPLTRIEVESCSTQGAYLYDEANYSGRSELFLNNTPDLKSSYLGKYDASSVKLINGAQANLFVLPNFHLPGFNDPYCDSNCFFTEDNPDLSKVSLAMNRVFDITPDSYAYNFYLPKVKLLESLPEVSNFEVTKPHIPNSEVFQGESSFLNYHFDYTAEGSTPMHFIAPDFSSRSIAPFLAGGSLGEADLHNFENGTFQWLENHIPSIFKRSIIFAHHLLDPDLLGLFGPFVHFTDTEFTALINLLEQKDLFVNHWFGGHGHKVYESDQPQEDPFLKVIETPALKHLDGPTGGIFPEDQGFVRLVRMCSNSFKGKDQMIQLIDDNSGELSPFAFNFQNLRDDGTTKLKIRTSGMAPPPGFINGEPAMFFETETSAGYFGLVDVKIDYSNIRFGNESTLELFSYNGSSNEWTPITTEQDLDHNIISGVVSDVDTVFALFEPGIQTMFQDGVYPDASYGGTQDTYVRQTSPTENYGSESTLLADGIDQDPVNGNYGQTQSVLSWDISSIPSNAVVQSVSITLDLSNTSSQPYSLYQVNNSWTEGSAVWDDFSNPGNIGSTVLGMVPADPRGENIGDNIVYLNNEGINLVQGWINGSIPNNGILIQNPDTNDGIDINSSEAGTGRPKLTINYAFSGMAQSIVANQDSYIRQTSPDTNYGSETELLADGVDQDPVNGKFGETKSVISWDVSVIPSDAVIQSVTLTIDMSNTSGEAYHLYAVNSSWSEGTVAWNDLNDPSNIGTTVLGMVPADPRGENIGDNVVQFNTDGVSLVQSWVDGSISNNGIVIGNPANKDGIDFSSREVASSGPKLTINYTMPSL